MYHQLMKEKNCFVVERYSRYIFATAIKRFAFLEIKTDIVQPIKYCKSKKFLFNSGNIFPKSEEEPVNYLNQRNNAETKKESKQASHIGDEVRSRLPNSCFIL